MDKHSVSSSCEEWERAERTHDGPWEVANHQRQQHTILLQQGVIPAPQSELIFEALRTEGCIRLIKITVGILSSLAVSAKD